MGYSDHNKFPKEVVTYEDTLIYYVWTSMKKRCFNRKHPYYCHYGGRGITVCSRWTNSFIAFRDDMGPRPSTDHSIERKDNDGDYEPSNCCWATGIEQALNRRSKRYYRRKRRQVAI